MCSGSNSTWCNSTYLLSLPPGLLLCPHFSQPPILLFSLPLALFLEKRAHNSNKKQRMIWKINVCMLIIFLFKYFYENKSEMKYIFNDNFSVLISLAGLGNCFLSPQTEFQCIFKSSHNFSFNWTNTLTLFSRRAWISCCSFSRSSFLCSSNSAISCATFSAFLLAASCKDYFIRY